MAAEPDPQQLLTALTTEHFTLQGARSQTVSESASRASLYLLSVSSTWSRSVSSARSRRSATRSRYSHSLFAPATY